MDYTSTAYKENEEQKVRLVHIRCKNTGEMISVPFGSTLSEVFEAAAFDMSYGPVCACVNNKVQGMNYRFYNNKDVNFLSLHSPSGMRTYTRTLFFVLAKAVEDLFPQGQLIIGAPVSRGYYCELRVGRAVQPADVERISNRMQEIIDADMPIHRIQCPIEDAIAIFQSRGMTSKVQLLESQDSLYTYYYKLDSSIDYFYGPLLTHTGLLHLFSLTPFYDGLLLRIPNEKDPSVLETFVEQKKMLGVIREHQQWQDILRVRTVGEFNKAILAGRATDLINVSEALQAKRLSDIADEIALRKARLVLIAGPSSSGKTTTAKRLAILMMACGLRPYTLSTDDYFVNRVDTPKDENGEYDFECIGAVDTKLFNEQMNAILRGEEVELPRYDFPTGKRVYEGRKLQIGPTDVIILEGNHALNPILTQQIPEEQKYRMYVSALTTIQLDDHNHISTVDIRLVRRILRDFRYRGYSAVETIRRCPSVKAGEEKWIFPYQELADATFNSALLYELGVIRDRVLPILEQVPERAVEYAEATRLRKFLNYFRGIPGNQVPPTSLLREFAGGSSFKY
ncbi:MAG: nucleoside kinase [Bacteroidaceae bacterium]|nr:nucleoside kinase [Bacteroidaceae bacterium]MBO4841277.1 nucleoside kinase [Bacteroidaceae bacterium]